MKLLQELLHKDRFSDTEQCIVDFLLEHHRELAELSARQLAEKAYTSSASVVRFCQRLGFKGYADFKIRFVAEAMQTDVEQGISLSMSNKDTVPSVIDKVTRLSMDTIQETRYLTEPALLVRTIHLIEQAECIDFYAIGNNSHLVDLASYAMLQTGKFSTTHHTVASLYMQAMATKKGRLGFIISRTGENKRLIEIARELTKRSGKFILLTAEKDSTPRRRDAPRRRRRPLQRARQLRLPLRREIHDRPPLRRPPHASLQRRHRTTRRIPPRVLGVELNIFARRSQERLLRFIGASVCYICSCNLSNPV